MNNRYDVPLSLRALKYFIENPYKEIYLREFSRELKISPNTAQRFLDRFLKHKLVVDFRKGNLRYFRANMDYVVFRQAKIVFSLFLIEDSGLVDYFRKEGVSHLVLFGSVAKGEDDSDSDVDLAVIGGSKAKIRKETARFGRKMGREVNTHIFSWAEWKKAAKHNKAFYQDVIVQGVALIGHKPIAND